ncbi:tribbles homolog 1 [Conger conger]|uniref:tribbles homolog 1 n=1 Tax=Conger conger TaxID=82655 RepID=UPI002A5AC152|nr:tribbles homolog 1 [Conger conger]
MSMNVQWTIPVPRIRTGRCRYKRLDSEEPVSKCARLSEPASDAGFSTSPGSPVYATPFCGSPTHQGPSRICQYLLLPVAERGGVHSALNIYTGEEYVCKVFTMATYQEKIRPHGVLSVHSNISQIRDIILGDQKAYVFLEKDYGDLHTFVKSCKRLGEEQASRLFYQVVLSVAHCHRMGIVLGDLKLRKFVFGDEKRTHLKLESLEDSHVLEGNDDSMTDKHGCPAYVSPEILNSSGSYSGKQADVWSLGIMLYTLLVGRYPFHDSDPSALFSKIRKGQYCLPDSLSPPARCLLRSLLRKEPAERLTAEEILIHPWFHTTQETGSAEQEAGSADQTVPAFSLEEDESPFC